MSLFTSYALFNDGTSPGDAADPDASTIGGAVETSFFHHWAITWCPTGQTLTPVSGGTFTSPFTSGPIEPMSLVATVTPINGFQAQIWNRTGSDANGSDPVYFQWSHSHTLASPPVGAQDNITDYVVVTAVSFSGTEDGFAYAYTPITSGASSQDFPDFLLPANTDHFDVGLSTVADADAASVDTNAGFITYNGPPGGGGLIGGGLVGRFSGLPSTDVEAGTAQQSIAPLPSPGMGGYTITGYSLEGPTSPWDGFLFIVAGYFTATPTGWRVGRVGAGNNPW